MRKGEILCKFGCGFFCLFVLFQALISDLLYVCSESFETTSAKLSKVLRNSLFTSFDYRSI